MLGIVDSARFTPRGALRLNHLFRCWTLRYACKHARSRSYTNPPLSKKSRCCYFFCEREWMKNRCKATVSTAQQQRRRCSLYIFLLCPLWRFVVYIQTYPTPRLSTSFEKSRCLFFMLGIVDSARFTPRGALRHEPPFGAGRFAMRASTLALALIRIHLFPP